MRFFAKLLFTTFVVFQIGNSSAADLYISTRGDDAWSGTLSEPNSANDDGPFASLGRARDAVRSLISADGERDIVVQIRGGEYGLSDTVVFGVEDSGVDGFSVIYEAYTGEKPVFHSDRPIGGWQKLNNQADVAGLPESARDKVWVADVHVIADRFYTLYDSDGALPRARSKGFIPVMPELKTDSSRSTRTELHFPQGRLKNWPNIDDVEIVVRPHHAWVVNILPLKSVDEQNQIARAAISATYAMDELHYLKGTESVWVENVLEALDQPGEWVLDSRQRKLYLWPHGEGGAPEGISVPMLQEYIRLEGDTDIDRPSDRPIRNLVFRGIGFTRGETYRVNSEDKGLQHDWDLHDKANALVRLRGAEQCVIEGCQFSQSGGGAIRVDLLGRENRIENNHIEHIGGTGILLCGYGPGSKDVNHSNLIRNNHIQQVGQIYAHCPGIFLWQSGENRVANNLIHHVPYAGIIVSGVMTRFFAKRSNARELSRTFRWHEIKGKTKSPTLEKVRPYLHSHDNLIEYNEIHHAMSQLGDGNGIYIRGAGAGNVIRRNYIHHLISPNALQAAIRTDGGQRDTLIAENIMYRCTSQGIQLKLNNRAENNFIIDLIESVHKGETRPASYFKLREGPLTGGVIKRNILYHSGANAVFYDQGRNPRLPDAWAKEADTDFNLYYCAENPELSKATLRKARRSGIDKNSKMADPLFIDPASGDFRFQPNSPAVELGIVPIDVSKIGLLK